MMMHSSFKERCFLIVQLEFLIFLSVDIRSQGRVLLQDLWQGGSMKHEEYCSLTWQSTNPHDYELPVSDPQSFKHCNPLELAHVPLVPQGPPQISFWSLAHTGQQPHASVVNCPLLQQVGFWNYIICVSNWTVMVNNQFTLIEHLVMNFNLS